MKHRCPVCFIECEDWGIVVEVEVASFGLAKCDLWSEKVKQTSQLASCQNEKHLNC